MWMPPTIYMLRQGNKTLSVNQRGRPFVVGFQTATTARKVHYSLHPEPVLLLLRDEDHDSCVSVDECRGLTVSPAATLFVPKCQGSTLLPMNDGGFHLHSCPEPEFMALPYTHGMGIVVAYKLEDEIDDEFVFKAYAVEPRSLVDDTDT